MNTTPQFDTFAHTYDDELNQALAASGEDKDYFARGRVRWLQHRMSQFSQRPKTLLDYGCSIGDTCVLLQQAFHASFAVGVDPSAASIDVAQTRHRSTTSCSFATLNQYSPDSEIDLAYCNGVFHHIPVAERASALRYVFRALKPGGWFAFWENNPWNPGTRHVMSNCAFDEDAITINPPQAKSLLADAGFQVVGTDFCFFFPRPLKLFRFLEPSLARLPLGAQYEVLCRKPNAL
jgi:ubiquinone/menaquinone biosynthesis C-methylase UbiE